jgi:hypothetical protein
MLKRRPSKRFVLAETGEEGAWNTTIDNNETTGVSTTQPPAISTPIIEVGLTLTSSPSVASMDSVGSSLQSTPSTPNLQLLHVPLNNSRIK